MEQMAIVLYGGPRATYSTFSCSQSLHSNINQMGHCCLLWLHTYCLFNYYCGNYGSCVSIYLWTLQPALHVCIFFFFLLRTLKSIEIDSSLRCHQWWSGRGNEQLPAALWWPSAPAKPDPSHSPEAFHVAWLQGNSLSWALLHTASLELLISCKEI